MNNKISQFLLGIAFIFIVTELISSDKKSTLDDFFILSATFNRIDGITAGSDVRISGVSVGQVLNFTLKKSKPIVSFGLEKNFNLPNDSSISIHTDGLFGEKYLSIEPGGSDVFLSRGDQIIFTEDSILVEELLGKIINIGEKKLKR